MRRLKFLPLALLALGACSAPPKAEPRYLIYLHAKIVEQQGRVATDSTFGPYAYDAILDSLRQAGFVVLSDQRPLNANSDSSAVHVSEQVDSLLRLGVPPKAITVVGFSKGGWIAILASAKLKNPDVAFAFLATCGPWSNDAPDLHVAGRLLSLYEESDSLGVSCAPMLARRTPGSEAREIRLNLGLGHGTFFLPRAEWLAPVTAWAERRDPGR